MKFVRIYGKWDEHNAVNAAADKRVTSKDMPGFYADAIRAHTIDRTIDFLRINTAILDRWAPSTLNKIKRIAWDSLCAERAAR